MTPLSWRTAIAVQLALSLGIWLLVYLLLRSIVP